MDVRNPRGVRRLAHEYRYSTAGFGGLRWLVRLRARRAARRAVVRVCAFEVCGLEMVIVSTFCEH